MDPNCLLRQHYNQIALMDSTSQPAVRNPAVSQVVTNDSAGYREAAKSPRKPVGGLGAKGSRQDSNSMDDPFSSCSHPPQTCCLIDQSQRCHEYAGSFEFGKRMQKAVKASGKLKLKVDYRARHKGICDYHNTVIRDAIQNSIYAGPSRSNSSSSENTESNDEDETDERGIDFSKFPLTTLLKYKKCFKIAGQFAKGELTDVVSSHFKTIPALPKEDEIVADFIFKIKYKQGQMQESDEFGQSQQAK